MASDEEQHGEQNVRYQGDAILLGSRVTEVEREQTESKKRDEEYKTQQLAINGRIATFTLWLVVCTAATGGIAIYQATIARRSATAAEEAAIAAKNAADAASNNAEIARWALLDSEETSGLTLGQMAAQTKAQENAANASSQNVYLGQRAWISVHEIAINPPSKVMEVGKPLAVHITFRNTGKSPAINVWKHVKLSVIRTDGVVPDTLPPAQDSRLFDGKQDFVGILEQDSTDSYSDHFLTPKLEQTDFDDFRNNKIHVFVFGEFKYCDVFSREHWTTFCAHRLSGGGWAICATGNDMDKENEPRKCSIKTP